MRNYFIKNQGSGVQIGIYSILFLLAMAFLVAMPMFFLEEEYYLVYIISMTGLMICVVFPRLAMILLGIYLVFQSLLAYKLGEESMAALIVKRAEEFVILIVFIVMALRNILMRASWKRSPIDIPLIILVSIAVSSSLINRIVPHYLAVIDLFMLLKGFLTFYIFYNCAFGIISLKWSSKILLAIALIVLLLGIIDSIIPDLFRSAIGNVPYIDYRFGISSSQSIFIHPGIFGWFMAFFGLFCFAFFLVSKDRKYLFFSILFILGVLLSMRFKPIAGLTVALLLAWVLMPESKKIKFVVTLGSIILMIGIFWGARISMLFDDRIYMYLKNPNLSNIARNVLYSTSLHIAKDYFPLGAGLATFGGWIAALFYSPLYIYYGVSSVYGLGKGGDFLMDTFWPYIIAQFGFLGAICYIAIMLRIFYYLIKKFRQSSDLFIRSFILGSIMILLEGMVESLAEPVFVKPPEFFFIFASLGIACSLPLINSVQTDSGNPEERQGNHENPLRQ